MSNPRIANDDLKQQGKNPGACGGSKLMLFGGLILTLLVLVNTVCVVLLATNFRTFGEELVEQFEEMSSFTETAANAQFTSALTSSAANAVKDIDFSSLFGSVSRRRLQLESEDESGAPNLNSAIAVGSQMSFLIMSNGGSISSEIRDLIRVFNVEKLATRFLELFAYLKPNIKNILSDSGIDSPMVGFIFDLIEEFAEQMKEIKPTGESPSDGAVLAGLLDLVQTYLMNEMNQENWKGLARAIFHYLDVLQSEAFIEPFTIDLAEGIDFSFEPLCTNSNSTVTCSINVKELIGEETWEDIRRTVGYFI